MSAQTDSKAYRLWVNNQLYIHVTHDGYAIGPCYEGALGCVLQVLPLQQALNEDREPARRQSAHAGLIALKIPRMMADTISENYYIADILEYEESVVFSAGAANALSGLVPSPPGNQFLLRGVRQMKGGYALDQDDSILFISFSKERFPRFCNVKRKDEEGHFKLKVFPPGAENVFAFLDEEAWEKLYTETTEKETPNRPLYIPVSCEPPDAHALRADKSRVQSLSKSVADRQKSSVWYVALPSISYNWAYSTLQESISKKRHKDWKVKDIYTLLNSVLTGVQTLHNNGSLHGDIRPANIMTVNQQTERPESYVLGDYGSFSMNEHLLALPGDAKGHTAMAGPGVSRHRTSVFYAPERRNGVERETADTVVILNRVVPDTETFNDNPGGIEYFLHFGWHKDLADNSGRLGTKNRERILSHWDEMIKSESSRRATAGLAEWDLRRRDRLRVRDYVFTITDSSVIDGNLYFRCHGRYATVLHERMAINTGNEIIPEKLMNIPHYVEIRQWSAATDLYGIGVLALYLVFSSGLANSKTKEVNPNAENMLSEILSLLDSKQNFKYLWNDLERFRRYLETFEEKKSGEELRSAWVHIGEEQKELYQYGLDFVAIIVRTIKYVDSLLAKFEYNIAHFLLFMHFVLSCLHRQTSTLPDKDEKIGMSNENLPGVPMPPFCVDRCDGVEDFIKKNSSVNTQNEEVVSIAGDDLARPSPALLAANRLQDLQVRFDQGRYTKFVCPAGDVPKYDPSSEFQAKIEKDKLKKEFDKLTASAVEMQKRINQLVDESKRTAEEVRKEWVKSEETLRKQHEAKLDRLSKENGQQLEQVNSKQKAAELECDNQKNRLRGQVEKLRQEITELKQEAAAKKTEVELKTANLNESRTELKVARAEATKLQAEMNALNVKLMKISQTLEVFETSLFGNADELKARLRTIL